MATITTDTDFQNALSYLTKEGQLPTGIQVNSALRVVRGSDGSDITPDTATLETALDGFIAWEQDEQTNETARKISRTDVRNYLLRQFSSDAPNWGAIYNNVKPVVDGNTVLTNRVNNIMNLYTVADGSTIDLLTNKGKANYIRAVLHVLELSD